MPHLLLKLLLSYRLPVMALHSIISQQGQKTPNAPKEGFRDAQAALGAGPFHTVQKACIISVMQVGQFLLIRHRSWPGVQALPLAELALDCANVPSRAVAEAVVEFFEAVSAVPTAQRAPQLGVGLFTHLLLALLRRARYPEGFTSWEACLDDDADSFHRFRRACNVAALSHCRVRLHPRGLLRGRTAWTTTQTASTASGALFCYRWAESLCLH